MPADSSPSARAAEDGAQRGPADRNLVGSLLHGLSILDMFDREHRTVAVGEMARRLKLHKSSASRLAATLASAGYLDPTDATGVYRLGSRLAIVGQLAAEDSGLEKVVLPHLKRLTWITGETGHLALLEGGDTRTVAITDGWHTVRMHSWVGKSTPAYCSSMGKALLAGLSDERVRSIFPNIELTTVTERTASTVDALISDLTDIRKRGYGFDNEELEIGLRCVSAPIVGPTGAVVAGLSISGPTQRLTRAAVAELADHVRWAAAEASIALGAPTPTPDGWAPPPVSEPDPLEWVEEVRPPALRQPPAMS